MARKILYKSFTTHSDPLRDTLSGPNQQNLNISEEEYLSLSVKIGVVVPKYDHPVHSIGLLTLAKKHRQKLPVKVMATLTTNFNFTDFNHEHKDEKDNDNDNTNNNDDDDDDDEEEEEEEEEEDYVDRLP
uniref:Uncharacterized protein n=1 Tax=Vespula pensylvanica TaxID=30213 RepID=A0A834PE45_VESPE|nr:hypothetical protein H0235_000356 [Vespula pensylvanica]